MRELLCAESSLLDALNGDSGTPLIAACRHGQLELVTALMELGANTEAAKANGATPLCVAAQGGHKDIVVELIMRGANVEAKGAIGWTSLHFAVWNGHGGVVNELLARGHTWKLQMRTLVRRFMVLLKTVITASWSSCYCVVQTSKLSLRTVVLRSTSLLAAATKTS